MPTSTRRSLAAWAAAGVLGTAVAAGAVVSAAGAASAAGTSGTTTSPTVPTATTQHRPWGALRHAGIHGEFTVKNKSGNFVVLDTQRGTVTGTTGSTLTVRSPDGFTATYTVDSTTKIRKDRAPASLTDIKVGDTVGVVGVKSGGTVTAKAIRDGVPQRQESAAPSSTAPGAA
ncbi:MAG TPA: DUF5666 domain-containing protein [Actinomycetes bacterium]